MRKIQYAGLLGIILIFTGMFIVGCGGSSSSSTIPAPPTSVSPIITPAPTPDLQNAIFVAPAGLASNPGTIESPTTLETAIKKIISGGVVYLRGGNYNRTAPVVIPLDNDGTATQPKYLIAYGSEVPVLDFSAQSYDAANPGNNSRGLQINGDYWYIKGLKVCGSADNGIYIAGSYNTVENCETYANRDSGLQLGRYDSSTPKSVWPSHNRILNCYSHDNYDTDNG
ncbi:MAG TPA: right-handed parallel beta-helix repeat-containing protein, partial [Bacillota bacterium]|nr:right-handed parallel beta-helix repeat-containing protein [Bacillota bacterium]